MKIACKCEKCGMIFMSEEDDLCLELDFKEKKFTFICRNGSCHHENILDFADWRMKQAQSPLPRMRTM